MAVGKQSEFCEEKPVVRTPGEVFSDGSILELVRIPGGDVQFLIWDGKSTRTAPHIERNGETFIPPSMAPAIFRSLQLPTNAAEHGSTRELFADISSLFARVTRQGERVIESLTFSVFANWLGDCFPFAPCLWIVAPQTTAPAAPVKQLLNLLCRRVIAMSDVSPASFRAMPMDLRPTLMMDIFAPTRRTLNMLRTTSRHSLLIAAGTRATDLFSPTIVFAPDPPRDTTSAGFPLELTLSQNGGYVPLLTASEATSIAQEYQAKLLHYRLVNWGKVRAPAFDLNQFTVPMQELAYTLGASIVDDDELQSRLVPLLKQPDADIRVQSTSGLRAHLLEALLARCHSVTGKYFPVKELTCDVNTIGVGRAGKGEFSPEEIGWALRGLELYTTSMPGGRMGLIVTDDVRKKIHELAFAYGVRTLRDLPAKNNCKLCAELVAEGRLHVQHQGPTGAGA
jgi:hypothetical protein